MGMHTVTVGIAFGEGETATVTRSDQSSPIVVSVLGVDTSDNGEVKTIYLRENIHGGDDESTQYAGWDLEGAITTIMEKKVQI